MVKHLPLVLAGLFVNPLYGGELIEIDIHGMTCPFCVDAVQRNLRKLPDVEEAQISLELKKARVHATPGDVDRDRLLKTIVDSGFTPVATKEIHHEH